LARPLSNVWNGKAPPVIGAGEIVSEYDRALALLQIRFALLQATRRQASAASIGADIGRLELSSVARRDQVAGIFAGVGLAQIVAVANWPSQETQT
jgi:hypothetical protein